MIGFIPAAGTNARWGSGYKELLPIGEGEWLLSNTIKTLQAIGCDKFFIGTSTEKISSHLNFLKQTGQDHNVCFTIGGRTMWETIYRFLPVAYERVVMIMPDTIVEFHNWVPGTADFELGLFETKTPERFSVYQNECLIKKPVSFPKGIYRAWGAVSWSPQVSRDWMLKYHLRHSEERDEYNEAFMHAMKHYKTNFFDIQFYRDFADWKDYYSFIKGDI